MVFANMQEYHDVTDEIISDTRGELASALLDRDDASGRVIELTDQLSDVTDDYDALVGVHERTVAELEEMTKKYDELYRAAMDALSDIETNVNNLRRDVR